MRVVVFGGTTEGETIAFRLAEAGIDVRVCVATEYGEIRQMPSEHLQILMGRQNAEQIAETLEDADLCIDATHPYADLATKNIEAGCQAAGVKRIRFYRPEGKISDDAIIVPSTEAAAECLKTMDGNVLMTTGAKELVKFKDAGAERLYPRVLPLASSLESCAKAGIPSRNIIAMHGPFIEEINTALMKQYQISIMVTKNSGKEGGFQEKAESCQRNHVKLIVIERPIQEEGYSSVEEIIEKVLEVEHE